MSIEILTISTKGQVVLPNDMRKELALGPGDKLVAYFSKEGIVLKRLELPSPAEFENEAKKTMSFAKESGLTQKDLEQAISEVRNEKKR